MERTRLTFAGLLLGALLQVACSSQPGMHLPQPMQAPPSAGQSEDRRVLAGEWEYEDGSAAYSLKLNEQGNGIYAWKDGRLLTTNLSDHTWKGVWSQRENDREGGFIVTFCEDFTEGEGRWWYDRIGTNTTPTDKSGIFHLSKKTSSTRRDDTPPTP